MKSCSTEAQIVTAVVPKKVHTEISSVSVQSLALQQHNQYTVAITYLQMFLKLSVL